MKLKKIVYVTAAHALLGVLTSFAIIAYGINVNVEGFSLQASKVAFHAWRVIWGPSIFIISKLSNIYAIVLVWIILSAVWSLVMISLVDFAKRIASRKNSRVL